MDYWKAAAHRGTLSKYCRHMFEQRYDWPYVSWYRIGWSSRDTFDCLAALPAPPQVVPFAPANSQNLQAVLSSRDVDAGCDIESQAACNWRRKRLNSQFSLPLV